MSLLGEFPLHNLLFLTSNTDPISDLTTLVYDDADGNQVPNTRDVALEWPVWLSGRNHSRHKGETDQQDDRLRRGARHGSSQAQCDYFPAKQCYKKAVKNGFKSVHDRFLNNEVYCASQLNVNWTQETCLKMDESAQHSHQYIVTYAERARYETLWSVAQRHTGKNTTVHAPARRLQRSTCLIPRGTEGSRSQRRGCNPKHSSKRSCSLTRCPVAQAYAAGIAASTHRLGEARSEFVSK